MTIKLRFDARPENPYARVWTEDLMLAPVAGFLSSELQSADAARQFAQDVKEVIAGRAPHFQDVGNGYLFAVSSLESEIGLNVGEDPETVTLATADLLAAVEEWAAHLDSLSARGAR